MASSKKNIAHIGCYGSTAIVTFATYNIICYRIT